MCKCVGKVAVKTFTCKSEDGVGRVHETIVEKGHREMRKERKEVN